MLFKHNQAEQICFSGQAKRLVFVVAAPGADARSQSLEGFTPGYALFFLLVVLMLLKFFTLALFS